MQLETTYVKIDKYNGATKQKSHEIYFMLRAKTYQYQIIQQYLEKSRVARKCIEKYTTSNKLMLKRKYVTW